MQSAVKNALKERRRSEGAKKTGGLMACADWLLAEFAASSQPTH